MEGVSTGPGADGGWPDAVNAAQLLSVMASGPTPMALTGAEGRWLDVNAALCELTGYDADELLERSYQGVTHPDDLEVDVELMRELRAGTRSSFELRKRFVHASGREVWIDLWVSAIRTGDRGSPVFLSQMRDVTAAVEAERALERTHERFRRMFDDAPIGMVTASADRRLVEVNDAFCSLLGYSREALVGRRIEELTHRDDRVADARHHESLRTGRAYATRDKRYVRADGTPLWVSVSTSLLRVEGADDQFFAQVVDINEAKRLAEELELQAGTDALTGLVNRRRFADELARHARIVERHGPRGALLLVDLDGLKTVNDSDGHAAGDAVIVAAARTLRERIRGTDVVARMGGDEFAVLIGTEGERTASRLAARVVDTVRVEASACTVTASVGVAVFAGGHDPLGEQTLAAADAALYAAKRAGRGRWAIARNGELVVSESGSRPERAASDEARDEERDGGRGRRRQHS